MRGERPTGKQPYRPDGGPTGARPRIHPEATDALLREIHHSARNNFQIIASLISLQKRMLPKDRREEVRFLEEHVQSMAAVYRTAGIRADMRVPVSRLVTEVVDNLRDIAGVPREALAVSLPESEELIEQRRAIALALFLAIVLPAYLGLEVLPSAGIPVALTVGPAEGFTLSIAAGRNTIMLVPLRQRLATSYLRQLAATTETGETDERGVRIRFPLNS
jgi:Histidine kinase